MQWFFASLLAPLVWSIVNHADKIILSRYFRGHGAGGLMIFVGVVSVPFAMLIALMSPQSLVLGLAGALSCIASGILYNVGAYLYLSVLEKHDASYVVPFWQLTPVCAYFFGIFFLGEYVESTKILGGLIVIAGAIILSLRIRNFRFTLDVRSMSLMVISSAALALGYVLFKDADSAPFWVGMFWNQIGMVLFGAVFFLVPQFRDEFLTVVRRNSAPVLALNIAEQALEVVGVVAANFAVLLAPAAIIILIEYSAQPVFVFLIGLILTLLLPRLVSEDIRPRVLAQKATAIAVMTLGLVLVL